MVNRQKDPIFEEGLRVEEEELNTQIDLNGCEFFDSDNEQANLFFENLEGGIEVEVNQWLCHNQLGESTSRGTRNENAQSGPNIDNVTPTPMEVNEYGCDWNGQVQSDYGDSEELASPNGSDNEGQQIERQSYSEFNEKTDFKRPINLQVGMKFANFKVYRQALKQYAIENGIEFKYIKNEASRIRVKCKHNCGWIIHASKTQTGDAFQIKSFHHKEHNCGWERENKWVSTSWLSNRYIDHIRDQPNWSATAFSNQVRRDHNVEISKFQAYRAKRMALEVLEGRDAEQFSQIYAYCGAIMKFNLGSTMRVKAQGSIFKRLYMCLGTCKHGFITACRPIICVDGCFLKGSFGRHLLSAVGKDANENMYPIAYAIVESECKDSWNWFMTLLFEDISSCQDKGWVVMSDMQKGLQEVLKVMECEHRFCVRHLYANFRLKYKGKNLKDEHRNACRATTKQEFNYHMKRLEELDANAANWLDKYDPRLWNKHAFSINAKCDIVQSNIAETFNSFILIARDKPIITMCEIIRRMLMKRMVAKREDMERSCNAICPRIMDKLQRAKSDSKNYICYMTGDGMFEIESPWKREVVDLKMMTCTCKAWDLIGIPCGHAVAAIYRMRGDSQHPNTQDSSSSLPYTPTGSQPLPSQVSVDK
ncbi:uncharacterized protein LOC114731172 [Neltuma alba]|uniref:uncharacterized protein LOC114731172 n=1 Tax=Neltuma alba TaxID=207710 RepID=UPI0010A3EB3F|nr:uncharacterized protein LOC114731172 [Prosopis alba]